ncbi:hypothetical protein [Streptomyces sp. NPDC048266]
MRQGRSRLNTDQVIATTRPPQATVPNVCPSEDRHAPSYGPSALVG